METDVLGANVTTNVNSSFTSVDDLRGATYSDSLTNGFADNRLDGQSSSGKSLRNWIVAKMSALTFSAS